MINYINIKVDYLIFIVIINKLLVFNISKYMNSLSASQYTNHTNDIYISINPTYINKASKTNKMELTVNRSVPVLHNRSEPQLTSEMLRLYKPLRFGTGQRND